MILCLFGFDLVFGFFVWVFCGQRVLIFIGSQRFSKPIARLEEAREAKSIVASMNSFMAFSPTSQFSFFWVVVLRQTYLYTSGCKITSAFNQPK